jgi:hypothetical protein
MTQFHGDEVERRRRMGLTYQRIALAASLYDQSEEPLQDLAAKIVASPLRQDIQSAGWKWLSSANRGTDGIALIGKTSDSDDGTYMTSESGDSVELISAEGIFAAQELLVLGHLDDLGTSIRVVHAEPLP